MEKYKTLYELFNEALSHFPNNKVINTLVNSCFIIGKMT